MKEDIKFMIRDLKAMGYNLHFINQLENLLKAYKEDEAVIEEMAHYIGNLDTDEDICKEVKITSNELGDCEIACKDCVKEYFRNKVKGEKE